MTKVSRLFREEKLHRTFSGSFEILRLERLKKVAVPGGLNHG